MTGENDRPNNSNENRAGPKVAKSNKDTKHYSVRIIFVFIIVVAVVLAAVTLQTHYGGDKNTTKEQEKSYRAPQPAGFTELAAGMRRDRKPVQIIVSGDEHKPEPTQPESARRITINTPIKNFPSLPRYYSDKNDAQAANTLRTLKLQALTAKPVVENFDLKQDDKVASTQRNGSPALRLSIP